MNKNCNTRIELVKTWTNINTIENILESICNETILNKGLKNIHFQIKKYSFHLYIN